ncbi:MAG: ImmA/IrrE family metallo-endopeptidase [Melioribacteraceae bacterium]|nr:ImmA/IrrE family metallo-endopeptidase [Melioribacteraceae bacterium]MCF8353907.1 ImmA/IrrE family metallo-endopeptidase [Melioribacteraceae bacterium]MCF8392664.1 ImmA/IrrE family metallo-endopeptidase [Melioribacteraceae bacterium]MCF8417685.1 ImmA/IrrE family metallo-endopeptidase [Melioribacteraceae bacterium]
MSGDYKIKENLLSPPGDTIQETIDVVGMNQYELAERLGKNIKNVNQMIKGKEPITYETAIALERVLDIPADFWLEREKRYRRELTEIQFDQYLEKCRAWVARFPVSKMKKLNWLPNVLTPLETIKALLRFFGIASPEQWDKIYIKDKESVAFRMSLASVNEPEAISAWLRKGEIDAKKIELNEFDKNKFKQALSETRKISYKHPTDFKQKLQTVCASAGVALVYTPNIPKAAISGAARWIFDMSVPLIQLSGRYKTNDHFWFTFFHEAGHIILHGKKDIFLEEVEGIKPDNKKENEADKFARHLLINDEDYKELISNRTVNKEAILKYSKKFKTHPGIIVGRLQHDKKLHHSKFNDLKVKIDLFG